MTLVGMLWRTYTSAHDGRSPFLSWVGIVYVISWLLLAPFVLLFLLTFMLAAFSGNAAQAISAVAFVVTLFAPILPRTGRA